MKTFFYSLKILRVIIALGVLVLICAQFFDIYHKLPKPYYMYNPTATQFMPSLLETLSGVGIVASGAALLFSVCALVFGRIYCSFFCVFGILMDALRRIGLWLGKRKFLKNTKLQKLFLSTKKMQFARARNVLRATMVFICATLIAIGWTGILGFLDPYSLFGKIMGSFVHPILAGTLQNASAVLSDFEMNIIPPVEGNPYISIGAFSLALLILLAIFFASILRGRIFCNTLCPIGATLGAISKLSIFKMRVNEDACIKCGACEAVCKAQCIDSKNGKIDFTRCVMCFNCASVCNNSAIAMTPALLEGSSRAGISQEQFQNARSAPKSAMPRRRFAKILTAITGGLGTSAFVEKNLSGGESSKICVDASPYALAGNRADKRLTVPAGAVSVEKFLENCTACQICTTACKGNVLKPSLGEWGLAGLMQPYMDFSTGYCEYTCHSCSKSCPTGAINFVSGKQKRQIKIGTAKFDVNLCAVVTDGLACADCADICPTKTIEMVSYGDKRKGLYVPRVRGRVCIGCGACEFVCKTKPHKAIVVQGLAKHRQAEAKLDPQTGQKPVKKQANVSGRSN